MMRGLEDETGKKLWRAWREEVGAAEAPDDLTLAAWLEGRLGEEEAGTVERWIARDPEAPGIVAALRESLAGPPAEVPQRLLLKLRALAPRQAGAGSSQRSRAMTAGRLAVTAGWAAAVLLAVLLGGGSFWMGQATLSVIAESSREPRFEELALLGEPDGLL